MSLLPVQQQLALKDAAFLFEREAASVLRGQGADIVNNSVVIDPFPVEAGQEALAQFCLYVYIFICLYGSYRGDIQTCSTQQSCDITFDQARSIVLNLDHALPLIEEEFSHAIYLPDAPER